MAVETSMLITVGSILISIGPCAILYLFFFLPRPHLVVISTVASFYWCLAMFLESAVWWAIPPLRQTFGWVLFTTVAILEVFRWLFYLSIQWLATKGTDLKCFVRPGRKANVVEGLAVGTSWGVMSVLVNYVSFLNDYYKSDSSVYIPACPINFWVAGSSFAMAFSIMHILLSMGIWQAYRMPKSSLLKYLLILAFFVLHLGFSSIGLGNLRENGCVYGMAGTWGLLFVSALVIGGVTLRNLLKPIDL